MLVKINTEVKDTKALNSLLQDESMDTYDAHTNLKIAKINALRLNLTT